jgi:urease accessory protein
MYTIRKLCNLDTTFTKTLALTASERTRSRYRWQMECGETVFLRLPRGTVLRDGDIVEDENTGETLKIIAKPEPLYTITAATGLDLLRAAYHLGNRHVPCEITTHYLRISPDPVLKDMLEHLGLKVEEDILPFQPETGAYGHHSH